MSIFDATQIETITNFKLNFKKMKKRKIMNVKTARRTVVAALAALLLWPLGASGQTVRGDYDYDGDFDITDLTLTINYLLSEQWSEYHMVERDTIVIKHSPRVSIVMVHVEGGSYSLGEGVTATVSDFWIGQTEVTKEQWWAVMNDSSYPYGSSKRPVNYVRWDTCQSFISRLNALTGREFRLPRSVEWEFAARGGNYSHNYSFAGGNVLDLVGWYKGNATEPSDVARLEPNELGLYDMSGNVKEWCQDAGTTVPYYHVVRGGSYGEDAYACLVTWKGEEGGSASTGSKLTGFRLVLQSR